MDYSNTPVRPPGTIRPSYWPHANPRTWGTVEEQVEEAQDWLRKNKSSHYHKTVQAYYTDCEHENPDDAEKYFDVDDLVDDWLKANCNFDGREKFAKFGTPTWTMYYANWKRAIQVVPLAAEYYRTQAEYEDTHNGELCLDKPAGEFCEGCQDDPYFEMVELGECFRRDTVVSEYEEFWAMFSEENESLHSVLPGMGGRLLT